MKHLRFYVTEMAPNGCRDLVVTNKEKKLIEKKKKALEKEVKRTAKYFAKWIKTRNRKLNRGD